MTGALNSVIAQLADDDRASLQNSCAYSPYGQNSVVGPDSTSNPIQYTSRKNDGTGLYFYRARYYNPVLKRFISSDPIGLADGLNEYAYVGGNPVSKSDPRGLDNPRMGPYGPKWKSWEPRPSGPPGSGCGDAGSDCVIPDFYPLACAAHDKCYETPGRSRASCDGDFWKDMFVESGPWPNFVGPTFFWMGVRLGGSNAYKNAQSSYSQKR
jgi:RHS repeat-associated protein